MYELSTVIYLLISLVVLGVGIYALGSSSSNSQLESGGKSLGISASSVLAIILIVWAKYYRLQQEERQIQNLSSMLSS